MLFGLLVGWILVGTGFARESMIIQSLAFTAGAATGAGVWRAAVMAVNYARRPKRMPTARVTQEI